MSMTRKNLIMNFVSAMRDGEAALFIGAGMSRPSGFVDWKELLKECARDLNLDLDREHDLVAVAQYYLNRRNRDRSRLNRIIKNEFGKPGVPSENHKIIARLPISTIWTTNFDSLLEDALRDAGRIVDVKTRDEDIPIQTKGKDVVVYKMHGDVTRPDKVIICKDDYERYAREHQVFQNTLEGHLFSKTFLFLGFSFADPHLEYMLGHLRSQLEDSKSEHYAIMRKARLDWHVENPVEAKHLYDYEINKQALQIDDLQRYSIQTLLVDDFNEITEVLTSIEDTYYRNNVFVSGSAIIFNEMGEDRVRDLCMQLGERLIKEDYRLISGIGLNIGDSVFKGALLQMYEMGETHIEKRVSLRPFPRNLPSGIKEDEFNQKYREDMIRQCGFAIFIAGNSRTAPESSRGVINEYEICCQLDRIPIPIGATGFAAKKIWEKMESEIENIYLGLVSHDLFSKLNDLTLSNEKLLDAVFTIMNKIRQP